jgi:hypothetical protein
MRRMLAPPFVPEGAGIRDWRMLSMLKILDWPSWAGSTLMHAPGQVTAPLRTGITNHLWVPSRYR